MGGSVIAPKSGSINQKFIREFMRFMHEQHAQYGHKFAIITGGGSIARRYQEVARSIHTGEKNAQFTESLDTIGIAATQVHAEVIGSLCTPRCATQILHAPLDTKHNAVMGETVYLVSGGWSPGVSTDYIATKIAIYLHATEIINISDTAYIYSADPRIDKNATRYTNLSWRTYHSIISASASWSPGAHIPFDPHASELAEKNNMSVRFIAPIMGEMNKALRCQECAGSIISG